MVLHHQTMLEYIYILLTDFIFSIIYLPNNFALLHPLTYDFFAPQLINHHHISHFINEADEDCLQYLKKLHVEEFDDSVSGFKISFLFEPNPYFENEVICKEISFGQSGKTR